MHSTHAHVHACTYMHTHTVMFLIKNAFRRTNKANVAVLWNTAHSQTRTPGHLFQLFLVCGDKVGFSTYYKPMLEPPLEILKPLHAYWFFFLAWMSFSNAESTSAVLGTFLLKTRWNQPLLPFPLCFPNLLCFSLFLQLLSMALESQY